MVAFSNFSFQHFLSSSEIIFYKKKTIVYFFPTAVINERTEISVGVFQDRIRPQIPAFFHADMEANKMVCRIGVMWNGYKIEQRGIHQIVDGDNRQRIDIGNGVAGFEIEISPNDKLFGVRITLYGNRTNDPLCGGGKPLCRKKKKKKIAIFTRW